MKRLLSLMFALIMVVAIFAACQNGSNITNPTGTTGNVADGTGGGTEGDVTDGETTDDGLYEADYLPDKDYNGYVLRSISVQDAPQINLYKDPDAQDKASAAQYKAIERVKDRFNLGLTETYRPSWESLSESVELMYAGQVDEADFNMLIQREAYRLGINGYLADWDDLIYCDETQPWYIHGINDQQRVGGFDYVNYTWSSMSAYGSAVVCYFNKDMITDLQLQNPYEMVENNTWTIENWYTMLRAANKDFDNDGVLNVDKGDRVGLSCTRDDAIPTIWMGAGFKLVELDEEDIPSFTASSNEAFVDFISNLTDIQNERAVYEYWNVFGSTYSSDTREAVIRDFSNEQSLFMLRSMNTIQRFGSLEFEWGGVPMPKLNEEQKEYISRVCDVWYTECVPVTCTHLEEASVFIEGYAIESLNYCVEAYYEQTLKDRHSDEETKKMLDIVRDTVVLDLGDTIWQDYCRNSVMSAISRGDKTFSSNFATIETLLPLIIERDLGKIQEVQNSRQ